jgi:2-desacetyl-2-hydroxyethyl bacteriochlorophyllide A dehydrogenase
MGYSLTVDKPLTIGRRNYDERALASNEVRIQTLYSGISAGTELTAFRGSNPYLHKHWDAASRLFTKSEVSWTYPMDAIGYEEVGRVVEVGSDVRQVQLGAVIWGVWGHRSTHIATQEWAVQRLLAPGLEPVCGIFSQIGAIALNAVLDANAHIGETVAVFGQGALGLMVTQLLKSSGVEVVAIDRIASRLDQAIRHGATHVIDSSKNDAATVMKELTQGRGADVVIEMTGAYPALQDAIRCAAYNSRVVVSGFFQGDAVGVMLGEEFHHNRIALVCSQISGLNPSLDHRWDRLRLDQTVMRLQQKGLVNFKQLISHTFSAEKAQEAFDLLHHTPADALQVVLEFAHE